MPAGQTWREIVQEAVARIGGAGSLSEIYNSVEFLLLENEGYEPPATWQAIVRRELEYNSSDSESYQHRADLFTATNGIGGGHWSLREGVSVLSHLEDVVLDDEAQRRSTHILRIVRDGRKVRELKALHDNQCQLCRHQMKFPDGSCYSEVHHLKPLGRPHNGPDVETNMIVVCPTCHVLLDFGARPIAEAELAQSAHEIGQAFIDYNNSLTRWRVDPIA